MAQALTGKIVSVQVGKPQKLTTAGGKEWRSGIKKEPVGGRVAVGWENVDGDGQADTKHHGGPDKAVCVYSAEHYPLWREEFLPDLPLGAFGENITAEGLTEENVCIGDVFRVGSAVVEVSQPRVPCANITKRWGIPKLAVRMEQLRFTGFYLRVRETGEIGAGDTITLQDRPHEGATILRLNHCLYGRGAGAADAEDVAEMRELAPLSAEWKRMLGRVLRKADGAE